MICCGKPCTAVRTGVIIMRIEVPLLLVGGVIGLVATPFLELFLPILLLGVVAVFHPMFAPCVYQRLPHLVGHKWVTVQKYGRFVICGLMLILNFGINSLMLGGYANTLISARSYEELREINPDYRDNQGNSTSDDHYLDYDYYAEQGTVFPLTLILFSAVTIPLTVVNLYTLCILYKHGNCFVYDIKYEATETCEAELTPRDVSATTHAV